MRLLFMFPRAPRPRRPGGLRGDTQVLHSGKPSEHRLDPAAAATTAAALRHHSKEAGARAAFLAQQRIRHHRQVHSHTHIYARN